MTPRILIIKTGALGDVLRTTSILPGLKARHPGAHVLWVTAPTAVPLVEGHPLVDEVVAWDLAVLSSSELAAIIGSLPLTWVISLDDESAPCDLATRLAQGCENEPPQLSGAYMTEGGEPAYTDDVEPWFGMGLLARDGKVIADRRKKANTRSHADIFGHMLEIEPGAPQLNLPLGLVTEARARFSEDSDRGPLVGLNTGAGGRWSSKGLDEERCVALVRELNHRHGGRVRLLMLGGLLERDRNQSILKTLGRESGLSVLDGGTDNGLLQFAAQIACCDLLVSSDSLAMHMGIALRRKVVAFFAPTSGAEIDLFGRGRIITSTSADYCSYRPDADNSSITPERIASAVHELLQA